MKIFLASQPKNNQTIFVKICWQFRNTDSDLKVHALHYANELLVLAFQKLLQTRQTSRNSKKLWLLILWETQKLTRYQSEEFSCLTNAKFFAYNNLRKQTLFIKIAKLKKFSTPKNSPCPLTQSIKVHRRAMVLLPCLNPCHRCENSQLLPFLIMQRDNNHARTHVTCV